MNVLFTGIYTLFNAGNTFKTAVGGRLYLTVAPQGATYPYAVYQMLGRNYDPDFAEEIEDIDIQFSVFSQNRSATEAGTVLGTLLSLYDYCDLTVTGYRHLSMERGFVWPNNDVTVDPPIHGYTIQYQLLLQKARS